MGKEEGVEEIRGMRLSIRQREREHEWEEEAKEETEQEGIKIKKVRVKYRNKCESVCAGQREY